MTGTMKTYRMITDFATGMDVPDVGAEANRQAVEKMLVREKDFAREDIGVDREISFEVGGEVYASTIDLVVSTDGGDHPCMVFKCVPGSFGSCEREILAAARLLDRRYQIPLAVISDGVDAVVLDGATGNHIGAGIRAIPDKSTALKIMGSRSLRPCPDNRIERERLIFRTYNCEYVNVARNLPPR